MLAIDVRNIVKRHGTTEALRGVSLQVEQGSIHGLIGADGAGKSSLFDILVTLSRPDSGSASVAGYDIDYNYRNIRRTVGYMPERFSLYGDLSVMENLRFFAGIFNVSLRDELSRLGDIWSQLEPFSSRTASKLSGGMKQKLALCCALIHNPPVVLMDEPTTGVDPVSRTEFWNILSALAAEGKSILVSTPYMDEAARCRDITLIHQGEVIAQTTPAKAPMLLGYPIFRVSSRKVKLLTLVEVFRKWEFTRSCYAFGGEMHLTLEKMPDKRIIAAFLQNNGIAEDSITISEMTPTIEDLFIDRIRKTK